MDELTSIFINDLRKATAAAKVALVDGNHLLCDVWLLTIASKIKSLEHHIRQ